MVRLGSAEALRAFRGEESPGELHDAAAAARRAWSVASPALELRPKERVGVRFVVAGILPGTPASPALRAEIIAHESLLLGPEGRNDSALLETLIHPDFDEIGRRGYYWERDEVLSTLQTMPHQTERVEFDRVIELAPGVAHIRFTTYDDRGIVRRSSIWIHQNGRWQQRYHQGTPDTQEA